MAQAQNMVKYIIKRILLMIPTIFIVLTVTFVLSRLMAGDPSMFLLPWDTPEEERNRLLTEMGFFDPWYVQLGNYYVDFFTGDLGNSMVVATDPDPMPVNEVIAQRFPATLELMFVPMVLVPILGVKMGVTSAVNRNKPKDALIRGIGVAGVAFPIFWIGMLVQVFSGIYLKRFTQGVFWFPVALLSTSGLGDPVPDGGFETYSRIIDCIIYNKHILLQDTLLHLILPVFCLMLVSLASTTRITRTSMLDVLEHDYIRTARAKGCMEKDVINKHALRNAMIPTTTVIIGGLAGSLMGSFLIEQTFNISGLGGTMFFAILYRDYWLINAITIYISVIVVSANLVADVMYTIIDPRIVYT